MTSDTPKFTIRASASRIEKGLIAVPQKFASFFPLQKTEIEVAFDEERITHRLTFSPIDKTTKESRIFGVATWFALRQVRPGDTISLFIEDPAQRRYRIVLDRYIKTLDEQRSREKLNSAATDSQAEHELRQLCRLSRRRPRDVAHAELRRISAESERGARPLMAPARSERHEGVPPGIRILLRELHDGRCQLCSFTFEKRNREPYFEIHHIDPQIGHHPSNLLVVCANCHAQLEQARITDLKWHDIWLVELAINGTRHSVRQPLANDSIAARVLGAIWLASWGTIVRLLCLRVR